MTRTLTADTAAAWLADFAAVIAGNAAHLTELDSAIGDADHGSNMRRGTAAVVELGADFPDAATLLKKAGMTLVSTVGGASGPLYGTFFLRFAAALPDGEASAAALVTAWQAGLEGIKARGKADVGAKTMIDALNPAVSAMREAVDGGADAASALEAAAKAAALGRDATVDMVATKGRASYLGERSRGHQDPGATSVTMLVESAARSLV